jgi:hypothetical protein
MEICIRQSTYFLVYIIGAKKEIHKTVVFFFLGTERNVSEHAYAAKNMFSMGA